MQIYFLFVVVIASPPAAPPPVQPPYSYAAHGNDWADGMCQSRAFQSPVDFMALNMPVEDEFIINYPTLYSDATISIEGLNMHCTALFNHGGVVVDNEIFELLYIDVHAPAEHTVRGKRYPMELQFYHKAPGASRVVALSVLVDTSLPVEVKPLEPISEFEADYNPDLQFIAAAAAGKNMSWNGVELGRLLRGGTFWQYDGSQTLPPCSEDVKWLVRREPLVASLTQVQNLYSVVANVTTYGNYRVGMPWNDRKVKIVRAVDGPLAVQNDIAVPLGPNPRTDEEMRATRFAEDTAKKAIQAKEYVKDLTDRIQEAAQAHVEGLQRLAYGNGGSDNTQAAPPAKPEPVHGLVVPGYVAKDLVPALRGALRKFANKVVNTTEAAAHDAAQQATLHVQVEAGKQQYSATLQ